MDMHPLAAYAIYELAEQRQQHLRESQAAANAVRRRPSALRRGIARTFAALTIRSARAVRRLDACLADDLIEGLTVGRTA